MKNDQAKITTRRKDNCLAKSLEREIDKLIIDKRTAQRRLSYLKKEYKVEYGAGYGLKEKAAAIFEESRAKWVKEVYKTDGETEAKTDEIDILEILDYAIDRSHEYFFIVYWLKMSEDFDRIAAAGSSRYNKIYKTGSERMFPLYVRRGEKRRDTKICKFCLGALNFFLLNNYNSFVMASDTSFAPQSAFNTMSVLQWLNNKSRNKKIRKKSKEFPRDIDLYWDEEEKPEEEWEEWEEAEEKEEEGEGEDGEEEEEETDIPLHIEDRIYLIHFFGLKITEIICRNIINGIDTTSINSKPSELSQCLKKVCEIISEMLDYMGCIANPYIREILIDIVTKKIARDIQSIYEEEKKNKNLIFNEEISAKLQIMKERYINKVKEICKGFQLKEFKELSDLLWISIFDDINGFGEKPNSDDKKGIAGNTQISWNAWIDIICDRELCEDEDLKEAIWKITDTIGNDNGWLYSNLRCNEEIGKDLCYRLVYCVDKYLKDKPLEKIKGNEYIYKYAVEVICNEVKEQYFIGYPPYKESVSNIIKEVIKIIEEAKGVVIPDAIEETHSSIIRGVPSDVPTEHKTKTVQLDVSVMKDIADYISKEFYNTMGKNNKRYWGFNETILEKSEHTYPVFFAHINNLVIRKSSPRFYLGKI